MTTPVATFRDGNYRNLPVWAFLKSARGVPGPPTVSSLIVLFLLDSNYPHPPSQLLAKQKSRFENPCPVGPFAESVGGINELWWTLSLPFPLSFPFIPFPSFTSFPSHSMPMCFWQNANSMRQEQERKRTRHVALCWAYNQGAAIGQQIGQGP